MNPNITPGQHTDEDEEDVVESEKEFCKRCNDQLAENGDCLNCTEDHED